MMTINEDGMELLRFHSTESLEGICQDGKSRRQGAGMPRLAPTRRTDNSLQKSQKGGSSLHLRVTTCSNNMISDRVHATCHAVFALRSFVTCTYFVIV